MRIVRRTPLFEHLLRRSCKSSSTWLGEEMVQGAFEHLVHRPFRGIPDTHPGVAFGERYRSIREVLERHALIECKANNQAGKSHALCVTMLVFEFDASSRRKHVYAVESFHAPLYRRKGPSINQDPPNDLNGAVLVRLLGPVSLGFRWSTGARKTILGAAPCAAFRSPRTF